MPELPAQSPTTDEGGVERHPAFAVLGASRVSYGPGGATLFDSDIQHMDTIRIQLRTATRRRSLHHDQISGDTLLFEVEMSQAQWAAFVSTPNVGDGVPVTLRWRDGEGEVPGLLPDPRLARSMEETHRAAEEAFGHIKDAVARVEKVLDDKEGMKALREAICDLHFAVQNATPNVDFAGKVLVQQAEDVVTKACADVEAFVAAKVRQLGVDPRLVLQVTDMQAFQAPPDVEAFVAAKVRQLGVDPQPDPQVADTAL